MGEDGSRRVGWKEKSNVKTTRNAQLADSIIDSMAERSDIRPPLISGLEDAAKVHGSPTLKYLRASIT